MKTIKVYYMSEIPKAFTGIVEFSDGTKEWYKEGYRHREDGPAIITPAGGEIWFKEGNLHREEGPAVEYSTGHKEWWINRQKYYIIILKDYLILDHYQGKYGLMWYKLLGKDKIIEYPDIPGLIIK